MCAALVGTIAFIVTKVSFHLHIYIYIYISHNFVDVTSSSQHHHHHHLLFPNLTSNVKIKNRSEIILLVKMSTSEPMAITLPVMLAPMRLPSRALLPSGLL